MFYFKQIIPLIFLSLFYYSCSPLKSSPNEEKHQMELTIHEMQTGIDDLRHNYNCYETELKILDSKIKNHETSVSEIKNIFVDSHKHKIEKALSTLSLIEKKLHFLEKKLTALEKDLELLNYHANESSTAFKQHKEKINELENQIFTQNKKFEEIIRLKSLIQTIAQTVGNYKIYKVQRGDSLEKIAKEFKINIQQLKKLNQLEDDLIVIGKELKIPNQ
jgi:LysM repeat protein